MSLDPLVVPKDKEVLKKDDEDIPNMQRSQTNKQNLLIAKLKSEKQNKKYTNKNTSIVLDYNS